MNHNHETLRDLIKPEIVELRKRGRVTWEEYEKLFMNSWEREFIVPALTNDCLRRVVENHILPNITQIETSRYRLASTYEESLLIHYLPSMLKRLQAADFMDHGPVTVKTPALSCYDDLDKVSDVWEEFSERESLKSGVGVKFCKQCGAEADLNENGLCRGVCRD